MHAIVIMFLVVYGFSMFISFLMWKHSRKYFLLLPTQYPWHSAFYSALAATVFLYFSQDVQDLDGVVLLVALPVLSAVLTVTSIIVLNLFRRASNE